MHFTVLADSVVRNEFPIVANKVLIFSACTCARTHVSADPKYQMKLFCTVSHFFSFKYEPFCD